MAPQSCLKPLARHPKRMTEEWTFIQRWISAFPFVSVCRSPFPSKHPGGGKDTFTMHWNSTIAHCFPLQQPVKNRSYIFILTPYLKPLSWDGMITFRTPVERCTAFSLSKSHSSRKSLTKSLTLQLSALSVVVSATSEIHLLSYGKGERQMKSRSTHEDQETLSVPHTVYCLFYWKLGWKPTLCNRKDRFEKAGRSDGTWMAHVSHDVLPDLQSTIKISGVN